MGLHHGQANFITYGKPSLFLDFANKKSLVDRISGNNLITFERASVGTYVGADGLIKTAAADEARFDHNPTTGESLGLLIEEQRTNLLTNSSVIFKDGRPVSDTLYGINLYTATGDGNTIAYISSTNGSGNSSFFSVTSGLVYTISFYAKQGTDNTGFIQLINGIGQTLSNQSSFAIPSDGGRISVQLTASSSSSSAQFFITGVSNGSNMKIGGMQVEQGSFPTSYIPTSGSTFTREPDNAQITGTNFSSWYNQSEGTIFAESSAADVTDPYVVEIDGSTGGNDLIALGISNLYNQLRANSNGSQVVTIIASAIAPKTFYKQSAGIAVNNFALSINGGSVVSDTSSPLPTVNLVSLNLGYSQFTSGRYLNGHIKQLIYHPTRLTNSQLQSLTQ